MELITWVRPSGREITTNNRKETIVFAENKGWKLKLDNIEPEINIETDVPVELAHARIESIINAMTDKDSIEAYVLEAKSIDLDKRGSLDTVKEKAIKALNYGNGS